MKKTGNNFTLDTCFIIDLFDNKIDIINFQKHKTFLIPSITIGELFFGASLSKLKEKHFKKINELISNFPILNVDEFTGKIYGEIKAQLKLKGTPIPENDIWIAALSIQHNSTLISNDKHFRFIKKQLKILNY